MSSSTSSHHITVVRGGTIQRKELTWNSIAPGDQYDIKQSTIKALPDDDKPFMGDKLEVLCMLQTVQIERLTESLNEYRQMYITTSTCSTIEKVGLDRHSYEVQIKELAERAAKSKRLQVEVAKLKEFIQRQSIEMEDVERKAQELSVSVASSVNTSKLAADYNGALREIQDQRELNFQLNWKVEQLAKDLQMADRRYEDLLARQQQEREGIRANQRAIIVGEKDREIQQINFRFGAEKYELEQEIARLREALRSTIPVTSQGHIFEMQLVKETLEKENEQLKREVDAYHSNAQVLLQRLGRQEEQLNEQTQSIDSNNRELFRMTTELNLMKEQHIRLETHHQQHMKQLSYQNSLLKDDVKKSQSDYKRLELEYASIEKNYVALLALKHDLKEYEKKLAVISSPRSATEPREGKTNIMYISETHLSTSRVNPEREQTGREQSKFLILTKEIERLNGVLHEKMEELSIVKKEFDALRQSHNDRNMVQSKSLATVEELEHKLVVCSTQIDRLNGKLRQKVDELDTVKERYHSMENQISSLKLSHERQISKLESHLTDARTESHRLTSTLSRASTQLSEANIRLESMTKEKAGIEESRKQLAAEIERLEIEYKRTKKQAVDKIHELQNTIIQHEKEESKQKKEIIELTNLTAKINKESSQFKAALLALEGVKKELEHDMHKTRSILISQKQTMQRALHIANSSLGSINHSMQVEGQQKKMLQERFTTLVTENRTLSQEVLHLKESWQRTSLQTQSLLTQSEVLQSIVSSNRDIQSKLAASVHENKFLKDTNSHLSGEVTQLKAQFAQSLLEYQTKISSFEEEKRILRRAFQDVRVHNESEQLMRVSMQQEISQKQLVIQNLERELQRTLLLMAERQRLSSAAAIDKQQQRQLIAILEGKLNEIVLNHRKVEADYRRNAQLNEQKMGLMTSQITRLTTQLQSSTHEKASSVDSIGKLNSILRATTDERDEWKLKFNQALLGFADLQAKSTALAQEYQNLHQRYNETLLAKNSFLSKINELEVRFATVVSQLNRPQLLMSQLKAENETLRQELTHNRHILEKNRMLLAEIQRLRVVLEGQKQELAELRIRFSDDTSLHKRIQEHLALFVVLFAEIESLRRSLTSKDREVEQMRISSLEPEQVG